MERYRLTMLNAVVVLDGEQIVQYIAMICTVFLVVLMRVFFGILVVLKIS